MASSSRAASSRRRGLTSSSVHVPASTSVHGSLNLPCGRIRRKSQGRVRPRRPLPRYASGRKSGNPDEVDNRKCSHQSHQCQPPPGDRSLSITPRDPVPQGSAVPLQPVRLNHPVPDAPFSGVVLQCDLPASRKMERRLDVVAVARFARPAGPGQFRCRAPNLPPLHPQREPPEQTGRGGPATAAVRDVRSSIESHGDESIAWDGHLTDRHIRSGAGDFSETMRTGAPRPTAGAEARVQASAGLGYSGRRSGDISGPPDRGGSRHAGGHASDPRLRGHEDRDRGSLGRSMSAKTGSGSRRSTSADTPQS